MNVYYRMIIDFMDESPIQETISNINEFDDQEEIEEIISGWSTTIILDDNKKVKTITNYIGEKDEEFFNSLIRESVEDYKHSSRFDHFNWIIEKHNKGKVFFIISFWDESILLDDFLNNLKERLGFIHVQIKNLKVKGIESKEYFDSYTKSIKNGFLECSTAWTSATGRYDYIHELYEDND